MGERYESVINLSKIAASGAEWAEQSVLMHISNPSRQESQL